MSAVKAKFKLNGDLQKVLDDLELITQGCDKADLIELWNAGYLPTGIMNYLLLLRDTSSTKYESRT